MKTATVKIKYLNDEVADLYMIDNEEDLNEYIRFNSNLAESCVKDVLHSRLDIEHFDHMIPSNSPKTGLMVHALYAAKNNTVGLSKTGRSIFNNPIYQLIPAAKIKEDMIKREYKEKGRVFIGSKGGILPLSEKDYTILNITEAPIKYDLPNDILKEGTKWIVLENDGVLPKASENYLKTKDRFFSTIYNLRGHTNEGLLHQLKRFKKDGGEIVFIFTTGLDVEQMYEYTECCIKADLMDMRFYFVSGTNPNINQYIEDAKEKGVKITIISQEEILGIQK